MLCSCGQTVCSTDPEDTQLPACLCVMVSAAQIVCMRATADWLQLTLLSVSPIPAATHTMLDV